MNLERSQEVLGKFADLAGSPSPEALNEWISYLSNQVYELSLSVAQDMQLNRKNQNPYWPTIAEFHNLLVIKQREHSRNELAQKRRKNQTCKVCQGMTWVIGDPAGVVPCKLCRAATHKHWQEGRYDPHSVHQVPGSATFPRASLPVTEARGETVVPAERAKQWRDTLIATEQDTYPEDLQNTYQKELDYADLDI